MLVKINDLQIGDEVIIPSNSSLKYIKILATPKPHPTRTKVDGSPWYKAVRCSTKIEVETIPATKWRKERNVSVYKFEQDAALHNVKISLDLNWKDMWLIKRENP